MDSADDGSGSDDDDCATPTQYMLERAAQMARIEAMMQVCNIKDEGCINKRNYREASHCKSEDAAGDSWAHLSVPSSGGGAKTESAEGAHKYHGRKLHSSAQKQCCPPRPPTRKTHSTCTNLHFFTNCHMLIYYGRHYRAFDSILPVSRSRSRSGPRLS